MIDSDCDNRSEDRPSQDAGLRASIPGEEPGKSDYQRALDFLYGRINYEKIGNALYTADNFRLDRMRRLLEFLGNPHRDYPIVHVAGSKGKGTVSNLIADCLNASGYRTGLYTSPHLLRLEERFQISGIPVSSTELTQLTYHVRVAAEKLEAEGHGHPTFFELTSAMGFLHFSLSHVDWVVLEVGLGGRLDSTNVCDPAISVITSISLDHQKQLGDTIAEIAWEKAGIIKQEIPVVSVSRHPDARLVIENVARERSAPLFLIDRDFAVSWRRNERAGIDGLAASVTYSSHCLPTPADCLEPGNVSVPSAGPSRESVDWIVHCRAQENWDVASRVGTLGRQDAAEPSSSMWQTRLLGSHQADNVAAALAVIGCLQQRGWKFTAADIQRSIARSHPPARLEVLGRDPVRVVDTAHNEASIQAGLDALATHFPDKRITAVFASSRDKNYEAMLRLLLAGCHAVVLTNYQKNPRALPVAELCSTATRLLGRPTCGDSSGALQEGLGSLGQVQVFSADDPHAAWKIARDVTDATGLIYVTGSFFLAAELLELLQPTRGGG